MGRTNIASHEYRPAEPVGAPSPATADAVWGLLPDVSLADIMPAYTARKNFPVKWRRGAELTAKQALVVALDTVMVCARDGRLLYATRVFDALARIWSKAFRDAKPARTVWDMAQSTVETTRRELLMCGIDFGLIWGAVAKDVPGLYTLQKVGGRGFARGQRVRRERGVVKSWQGIASDAGGYRSPWRRVRLLRADQKPSRIEIMQSVAAECAYDRMEIGKRSKAVIRHLQAARLFLDVGEIAGYAKFVKEQRKAHPWRGMLRKWGKRAKRNLRDRDEYQAARKKFMSENAPLHKEFLSLSGQEDQLAAIAKEAKRQGRHVDEHGFLAIRSGYYRARNRRWQTRNIWVPESSSRSATAVEEIERWVDNGVEYRASIETSQRGEWFYARPIAPGGPPTVPVKTHAQRAGVEPLVGYDVSFSMGTIQSVLLGLRDVERLIAEDESDFKNGLVEALPIVANHVPGFRPPTGQRAQLRKAMGALQNIAYGASLGPIARDLNDDPTTFGTGWGTVANLRQFLVDGREYSQHVDALGRLKDEWLTACRGLVTAAAYRDAHAGVSFVDPFDSATVRWHPPGRATVPVGHNLLFVSAPLGEARDREYPVNYFGVARPVGPDKTKRETWLLHSPEAKVPPGWRRDPKGSLYTMLAPCLIHTLDAAFAGCVVELLVERGVRDFAIVHDCFLVPADAEEVLTQAIIDAARPWFLSLGPVYDLFDRYLDGHPIWAERVRTWRTIWETRKAAGDWPKFRVKAETTQAWKVERV
jgi:hypothetical protein